MAAVLKASFGERITRAIVEGLVAHTNATHSIDIDLTGPYLALPATYNSPYFSVKLSVQADKPRLPLRTCKATITVAINKEGGQNPFEQQTKLYAASNLCEDWFNKRGTKELHARNVKLTSENTASQGDYFASTFTVDFITFLFQGEY